MKDDDTSDSHDNAPQELNPSRPPNRTTQERKSKSDPSGKKAENQNNKSNKWSLLQHWQRASKAKRVKWAFEGLGFVVGLCILGVYISDYVQNERHFVVENRPHVIVSRPPTMYGVFSCQVADNAIHQDCGPMSVWVKNIGKGDAINAFIVGPQFELVPDNKIGIPAFDNPPSITDESCGLKVESKTKQFPVYAGQEVSMGVNSEVGIRTLGNELKDLQKPSIPADAIFQLYATVCVYYFDRDGARYGTCRTYRLNIGPTNTIPGGGKYSFSCTQTPVK